MDVIDQSIQENYALYNGDCVEVMRGLPSESIHLSVYSPPFCGLYHYSSSEKDLSNCRSYPEFIDHYGFVVAEIARLTIPGRHSAVHCMDVPLDGANAAGMKDFPGDIIRLHEKHGFTFWARHCIWKEPLEVRNRTMSKGLAHRQTVEDSTLVNVASCDQLLFFRRNGENPVPVAHPTGFHYYAGDRKVPSELRQYCGHTGKQTENRYSHWIWRQYASSVWDDIRLDEVLPYREARDSEDERHVHPLQLDVIERCIQLRTNPGEVVLTPFMGVGSEVYGAVRAGRRGIGIELKPSYYRQAERNVELASLPARESEQETMFAD